MGPMWLLITQLIIMFSPFCLRFENSILKQLILDHNALDQRRKIFCVTIYLETKSFKTVQAKLRMKFNLTIIPRKAKLGTQSLKIRKSQIWQGVDNKMSWQCGCGERFCQTDSVKSHWRRSQELGLLRASLQRILKKNLPP